MSEPQPPEPFFSKSTKTTLCIVAGVTVLLVILSFFGVQRMAESQRRAVAPARAALSPQEHLDEAKDHAAKRAYGVAKEHIEAIPETAPEYKEAQKFWRGIKPEYDKIEGARAERERDAFADVAERHFLESHMDVYVTVSGPNKTTIKFKYVLMSRPTVYNVMNDSGFVQQLKDRGFKKVIFTDGYDETWEYGL
jgi:hypothetical protein